MKKTLRNLFVGFGLFAGLSATAQTSFNLDIKHHLNAYPFAYDSWGLTQDSTFFKLDRLEYYISEVTITHDGGIETTIADLWILVDAANETVADLGSHNIDSVESISFYIGVDPDHNHLDPSVYPSSHPLALKVPSMHWGWSGGYRFAAVEGADENETAFQIHALGDVNYFEATVETGSQDVNGTQTITVYANYSRAFDGIDITKGVINHGETDEAEELLLNFNQFVFTAGAPTDTFTSPDDNSTSIAEASSTRYLQVMPNPASNNRVSFKLNGATSAYQIQLFDITGKLVAQASNNQPGQFQSIENLHAGLYFMTVTEAGSGFSETVRVIVK